MKRKASWLVLVAAMSVACLAVILLVWRRGAAPGATSELREAASDRTTLRTGPTSSIGLGYFTPRAIGDPIGDRPWITDLCIGDLDQDGWRDVVVCDGQSDRVSWIRQSKPGVYSERTIGQPVAGPAHVELADLDGDGDLDVLVASMGVITPNNDKIGSVVVLENDGRQRFTNRVLISDTYRVTYVGAGDLDGDDDLDLSVGQFGYLEGEVRWMENLGDWKFRSHSLLPLSGTVHAPIGEINGDDKPDIVALVSQDWEEIHVFDNQGSGRFTSRVVYGSTNKDYGSSGLALGDIDGDGDLDIAYTNGDGFDYATPGSRPWHGVQWLENSGTGTFVFHRLGTFSGAYSPLIIDLDGDGDWDVVASSAFNDWIQDDAVSLMWFENDGGQHFQARPLAYRPTHLVVVDGADMDNDGDVELVTGGLYFYPPYEHTSRVTLWERVGD